MGKGRIVAHIVNDGLLSMDNGGVIAASEMQADHVQRACRKLFAQIHGNLSRLHNLLLAGLIAEQLLFYAEKFCRVFLDRLDR